MGGSSKGGGSSKETTVGYEYYLGMHMILCQGPVDKITRIRVGGKTAWVGSRRSGRIYIQKPSLFGGSSREGGLQGAIDFEPGEATQGQNSYLRDRLGSLTPNFRGVVGVVLRQFYVGMNPYLKTWDFRVTRILKRQDGNSQWYPSTALIPTADSFSVRQRILLALDDSGSMDTPIGLVSSKTRLDIMKDNIVNVLDEIDLLAQDAKVPVDIAIDRMNGGSISRTGITSSDITDLKNFVLGMSASGGTDFTGHFSYAKSWFSAHSGERRNVMLVVTDGLPNDGTFDTTLAEAQPILERSGTWSGNNEVDVHAVNIDLGDTRYSEQIDNTPEDGVPTVDGSSSSELYNAVFFAFTGPSPAMNIIHAIRECLTDPVWGMGYPESELDDASFRAAALQLREERLGICLIWDRQKPIEEMVQELLRHADASLYIDRRTGLFTIKLIRDDYDTESILHLTEENIVKVENFSRSSFGELTTAVTVNYWNVTTGENASVTAEDIALANMQQATISTTLQYPGIPDPAMAGRIAQRELKGLSTQLANCTIYADRSARNEVVGGVIKVSWPDYGLEEAIFRITGIAYGDGKENRIKLTVVEDVFATPETSYVAPSEPIWEDPSQPPEPLDFFLALEAPYLELVQRQGQKLVDDLLSSSPEVGYVVAAAGAPEGGAINARMYTNSGSGYDDAGVLDFSPTAEVSGDIGRFDTTIPITNPERLDQLSEGTWAQINSELLWVVSFTETSIEVIRGILDTIPQEHSSGDLVLFWDEWSTLDSTEYVESDLVEVKVSPVSGSGEVAEGLVTPVVVGVEGRAARPYRPANFRVEGDLNANEDSEVAYPVTATWSHRNRLQETGGVPLAWTDASVTPEPGTTYRVTYFGEDATGTLTQFHQEDIGLVDTYEISLTGKTVPSGSAVLVLEVHTMRDGLESWKPVQVRLPLLEAPTGLTLDASTVSAPSGLTAQTTSNN